MSIVIAIKGKDRIYLAADCQNTAGNSKMNLTNENNLKIWKTKGLNNSFICHTGVCRDIGIIRYNSFVPADVKNIDMEFVQGKMVYDIFNKLDEYGFTTNENGPHIESELLFSYKDKAFAIFSALYVIEIEDYRALGSGEDFAMGSLASTVGEPVEKRLLKAVLAAKHFDRGVGLPAVITDTKTCEFKFYDEDEINKLISE